MPLLTEVDRLEVQVLVDNVTDSLSSTPPFVTREWPALVRQGMRRVAGASLCCANHGLSLVLRATAGGHERVVLFDAGPVDYAVEHNGTRLGIDFGAIEAVVLSHGHWDHGGGLLKAFELIRAAAPQRSTPVYLHPGMFAERGQRQPDGGVLPSALLPTPDELTQRGCRTECHRQAAAPARRDILSERRDTARDDIRDGAAQPGPPQRERRLGTRSADHGRALPRSRGKGQGHRRVHRVLARRRGERPAART